MAYQTGTATSPTDLLQKIQAFISANGWTIDQGAVDGTGYRLHAHRGAVYVNLRSAIAELRDAGGTFAPANTNSAFTGINIYTGNGYNAANDWRSQSGGPIGYGISSTVGAVTILPSGVIVAYHMFSNDSGDHIAAIIERTSGVFVHLGWGISIDKAGAFSNGDYFFGSVDLERYINPTSDYPGCLYGAACPGSNRAWPGYTYNYGSPRAYIKSAVDGASWVGIGNNTLASGGRTEVYGWCSAAILEVYQGCFIPSYHTLMDRSFSSASNQSILLPIQFGALRSAGGYSVLGTLPHIFSTNACQRGAAPASEYLWGTDTYMVFPSYKNGPDGYAIRKVV